MTARSRAEAILLGTTFIWGSTFTAMKIGLEEMLPFQFIAFRFLVATLFLVMCFAGRIFPIQPQHLRKGMLLGVILFLGFVTQTFGLQQTTASKSAFITSMMVVGVPFLQIFMERRAPKIGNMLGIAVVVAGLWLLTSPAGGSFTTGDWLTLLCAAIFGGYIVYLDIVSREIAPFPLTFLQLATMAVLSLVGMLALEPVAIPTGGRAVATVLYLALVSTVVTTYLQTKYQKDTTPTRAAIIFTIEPVLASIIAYLVLDERMGTSAVFGGGLIVGGILLSELSDGIPLLRRSVVLSGESAGGK